jgi:hypothetical protein
LLTCEGFVTPAVESGVCTSVKIGNGYGDLDFNPDGDRLATSCQADQGEADNAPLYGFGSLNVYDFNNWTGEITNRMPVGPPNGKWSTIISTNVLWNKDGTEIHWNGFGQSGMFIPSGSLADMRNSHTSTPFFKSRFFSSYNELSRSY